jgi:hypothetical protein
VVEALNNGKIILLDINGRQVMEFTVKGGKNEINTSVLEAGIYTIRIVENSGVPHFRIVKGSGD